MEKLAISCKKFWLFTRLIYYILQECEKDLREFLEREVGHLIGTNIDELKGLIKIKGADRSLVEQFIYDSGF